jgi:hypothetical protein
MGSPFMGTYFPLSIRAAVPSVFLGWTLKMKQKTQESKRDNLEFILLRVKVVSSLLCKNRFDWDFGCPALISPYQFSNVDVLDQFNLHG